MIMMTMAAVLTPLTTTTTTTTKTTMMMTMSVQPTAKRRQLYLRTSQPFRYQGANVKMSMRNKNQNFKTGTNQHYTTNCSLYSIHTTVTIHQRFPESAQKCLIPTRLDSFNIIILAPFYTKYHTLYSQQVQVLLII